MTVLVLVDDFWARMDPESFVRVVREGGGTSQNLKILLLKNIHH